jgi:4-hydroxybenzoate polyprenyltransferase
MRIADHPLGLIASISRLHIVAIAAMGTFTFGWLFTGQYPWLLTLVCALDWFLVNLLNRVVDLAEDEANQITGTDFVARHRRKISIAGFVLLLLSFPLVHVLAPQITLLRGGYHALGLAYNYPLLPGGRRIKQLYFWKNTASAMGFVLTVFLYPIASAGWGAKPMPLGIDAKTMFLSGGFFVLFELSYEVIYDLRDEEGDRAASVNTYPVVHGRRGAVHIIDGLLAASLLFLIVGYALGSVPWRIFIMSAAPLIQWVLYKRALKRGISKEDCIRLTWLGTALLFGYHIWIQLGLPGVGLSDVGLSSVRSLIVGLGT